MNKSIQLSPLGIIYTTDVDALNAHLQEGIGLHLLCRDGCCTFSFSNRSFSFGKNDAIVITRPDLLKDWSCSNDFAPECLLIPLHFIENSLPANHYGIGGGISLWNQPVIHLSNADALKLQADFHHLKNRLNDTDHKFYREVIGSLTLAMVYDLFDFHAKTSCCNKATERTADLVGQLVNMLSSGKTKRHRDVTYYADALHVTPKYLSNVIKRQTGHSVRHLIDQHTIPHVVHYLKNSTLSISQISDEFHFTSLSYFSRYVVRHLGMTPSAYRTTLLPKET